jgi:hypothetical protein
MYDEVSIIHKITNTSYNKLAASKIWGSDIGKDVGRDVTQLRWWEWTFWRNITLPLSGRQTYFSRGHDPDTAHGAKWRHSRQEIEQAYSNVSGPIACMVSTNLDSDNV